MTPQFQKVAQITMAALIVIAFVVFATGCAEYSAFKSGVGDHGAAVADEVVDTNLWALCNAAPVGSINRRFKTEEERQAYRGICPANVLP